jgi:hypothetical protein
MMLRKCRLVVLFAATAACGAENNAGDGWIDMLADDGSPGETEARDAPDGSGDILPDEARDLQADDAGADDPAAEDALPLDTEDDDALLACPPPGAVDCSPGPGTGEGDECFDGVSCFISDVQGAVRGVIADHPELFDSTGDCDIVLDPEAYRSGVVERVQAGGLCAFPDPNSIEEFVVKFNNAYSENFDILASTGCARYGPAIYTSTCAPAWL